MIYVPGGLWSHAVYPGRGNNRPWDLRRHCDIVSRNSSVYAYFNISCHARIMSRHAMPCHMKSNKYHIISYHTITMSCHIIPCRSHIIVISCRIVSYNMKTCHIISYFLTSCFIVVSCCVTSRTIVARRGRELILATYNDQGVSPIFSTSTSLLVCFYSSTRCIHSTDALC